MMCTASHIQDSPGGVVETETVEIGLLLHGGDVEDAMIAVEEGVREGGWKDKKQRQE